MWLNLEVSNPIEINALCLGIALIHFVTLLEILLKIKKKHNFKGQTKMEIVLIFKGRKKYGF